MANMAPAIVMTLVMLTAAPAVAQMPGGSVDASRGEQVYVQVCQACHMADARGGTGAATIPALANNPRLAVAGYPITMILKGRGAMPPLADLLAPAQIAAVTGYIRTHFGNDYPAAVAAQDVVRLSPPKSAH
jgi:mono/diheme cytochrome c family protein